MTGKIPLVLAEITLFSVLAIIPGQNFYSTLEIRPQPEAINVAIAQIPISLYPMNLTNTPAPALTAQSALVMDIDSAVVLYQKNIKQRLYPASTTKIMTALVAIENYSLDQIITVGEINSPPIVVNLVPGEKISVENLLYATLISSGNDAAEALARAHPEGRNKFIELMNEKAKDLSLLNTQFQNPTGIDEDGHYSTALDLGRLAIYALKHPVFARIVATSKASVFSADGHTEHKLNNVNELLDKLEGVKGVKTGYTEKAGQALVALTQRRGHQILTVVLGSTDRFGETKSLIEWAFASHNWINPAEITPSAN